MKRLMVMLSLIVAATGCGPRNVEVHTGAQPASEVTLKVTNNLRDPVNVYLVKDGATDVFLIQVSSRTTESVAVPGVAAGTVVGLKATPIAGTRSYTRDHVILTGLYQWQIP